MKVYLLESDDWDNLRSHITKKEIKALLEGAAKDAAVRLKGVSNKLNIIVKPGLPHVAKELGVGGSTYDPELLDFTFDPKMPFGVDTFKAYAYQSVFHEMNHALRYKLVKKRDSLVYDVLSEGLAVVFERDYANASRWTKDYHEAGMKKAFSEMFDSSNVNAKWFFKHAYFLGPWVIDRAVKNSGKSVIELTGETVDQILQFAGLTVSQET